MANLNFDHLPLKLTNVAAFIFFFGSNLYSCVPSLSVLLRLLGSGVDCGLLTDRTPDLVLNGRLTL